MYLQLELWLTVDGEPLVQTEERLSRLRRTKYTGRLFGIFEGARIQFLAPTDFIDTKSGV
jgi:hypothetical protein